MNSSVCGRGDYGAYGRRPTNNHIGTRAVPSSKCCFFVPGMGVGNMKVVVGWKGKKVGGKVFMKIAYQNVPVDPTSFSRSLLLREVHGSLDQILYVHIQHQFQPVRIDLKG